MTKFQKEIIEGIHLYEELRKEALEEGKWNVADECLTHIKRLDISFRYSQMRKYQTIKRKEYKQCQTDVQDVILQTYTKD